MKYLSVSERTYWDANLDRGSVKGMANFFRALVLCSGEFHDSYVSDINLAFHHQSVFTRISLPAGAEGEFEEISGIKLEKPPTLDIPMTRTQSNWEEVGKHQVKFVYRNYKGDVAERIVIPQKVYYGSTTFHPERQWLLQAWDILKAGPRTFAMRDITGWRPL